MKPLLFNTDMARAILNVCKTVTRRVVKGSVLDHLELDTDGSIIGVYNQDEGRVFPVMDYAPCRPGDILYVRETFQIDYLSNIPGTGRIHYKADDTYADFSFSPERYEMMRRAQLKPGWRPNENMPREAARIFLRATNVYPQQLKDVTEADARAEGFSSRDEFMIAILKMYPDCTGDSWFWVIEFERISREEAQIDGRE